MYLIFDTETTGLPRDFNAPITDTDNWPRCIQIAWQLHDDMGQLVEAKDYLVKPDGFDIPYQSEKIHGISTDLALEQGESLAFVLEEFNNQLVANSAKTIERFLAIQAMGSQSARQDIKQLKSLIQQAPATDAEVLKQGLDILEHQDLRQEFARLSQPVGAIFGRLDALVPYKAIEKMQQLRPQLDIAVLDKASHAPFISHKEEFIAALKSML